MVEPVFTRPTLELLTGLLDAQQIAIGHPDAETMMRQAFQAKRELGAALAAVTADDAETT